MTQSPATPPPDDRLWATLGIPSALLDELDRTVLAAGDASTRAAVVCVLVYELYYGIAWLGRSDTTDDELKSLATLLDAVDSHHQRQVERQWPAVTDLRAVKS